ncbi:unnamed protein product [Colletotrichum noveboracense]|uniref:Heterokaryon incompatibility domain-containing protein n=1 Tax=Colletotrichum noveboracense TaxID=2664923 RepID=A0A9W4WH35_9PEZI|nr:unnamed protein product [Colletotrichum noveboracense]
MRVRFNCWYALWQMRHHGHTSNTSFWIDSLCINQDDDDEKGHQVAMMGVIFSSASSVAASLGTGESLGNVRETLASGDKSEIGRLRDKFDQLPYFDRVWIKQEIVLAKDIGMFYGPERLSWGQFDQIVNANTGKPDNNNFLVPGSSRYQHGYSSPFRHRSYEKRSVSIQLCNHRSQVTKTSTLMDLVVKYETAKASVAADKIYALLSLLPQTDPIRRNISVTYGEATWFPLFRTLVRLFYSHYQDQDLGDKHSVLCMIRDSLGICGLDEDVSASLEPQAGYPLDARSFRQESVTLKICCLHVLNDENVGELEPEEFRVEMKTTKLPDAARKLDLFRHGGNLDHEYTLPSTTGRDGYSILPELYIPPQLESLRTIYNFPNQEPFDYAGFDLDERFLVSSDVRPGDLLSTLTWDANADYTKPQWDLAHIILRRTTFENESENQESDMPFEEETKRRRTAFFLHSRGISVRRKCTMLSKRLDCRESDVICAQKRRGNRMI